MAEGHPSTDPDQDEHGKAKTGAQSPPEPGADELGGEIDEAYENVEPAE